MRDLFRDLRYGFRMLAHAPGASAVAILALALGIGANATIFSVVHAVLLRGVPVPSADRLVTFVHRNEKRGATGTGSPYADVAEWRKTLRSFDGIAGVQQATLNLSGETEPERVLAARVNDSFFRMLGIRMAEGRDFLPEEDRPGAGRVVILRHELWTRRYASSTRILEQTILLDGEPYRVIGVLPRGFRFIGPHAEVYVPLALPETRERMVAVTAYGRIKNGIPPQQMLAELDGATAATVARTPRYQGWQLRTRALSEWIVPDVKLSLWLLLGAVGILLLMACANVANLLLCRALARRRELALRAALGAGRGRLIREMILESLPIGVVGAVAGLLLTVWGVQIVSHLSIERIPRLDETAVDATVLLFLAGVSLVACLLFSVMPAIPMSRANVNDALKDGLSGSGSGVRGQRIRSALVVVQVALGLMLAVGAVLMVGTFARLSVVHPGFDSSHVFTAGFDLPRTRFKSPEQVLDFYRILMDRVRAVPGVESATITNSLPLGGSYFRGGFAARTDRVRPESMIALDYRNVDEDYAKVLRIPLLRGRFFTADDRKGGPGVLVLNESAARRLFGDADALGREVMFEGPKTVIGIVPDTLHEDITRKGDTEVLLPIRQMPVMSLAIAVRLNPGVYADAERFNGVLRSTLRSVDPMIGLYRPASMERLMANRLAARELSMIMLAWFAAAALVLAALGLYGVLSYGVERRFREIGIRMALGAEAADMVRMVVRQGLILVGIGVVLGTVGAVAGTRLIASLLYGVSATSPAVYLMAAMILFAVAAVASYVPARRAARVDPVVALRQE